MLQIKGQKKVCPEYIKKNSTKFQISKQFLNFPQKKIETDIQPNQY